MFDGKVTLSLHMAQYDQLRIPGYPPPNVCDVYVRAADAKTFFYVGKSCARAGRGGEDGPALSVVLQKGLVLEHAKALWPELGQAQQLEVWCAPPSGTFALEEEARDVANEGTGAAVYSAAAASLTRTDVGFLPEPVTVEDLLRPLAQEYGGSAESFTLRPDGRFPLHCPWLCMVATGS